MLEITAPMPGLLIQIHKEKGDHFRVGEPLFILEAMKMENVILAKKDGVIKQLLVEEGSMVAKGEVVIRYDLKTDIVSQKTETNTIVTTAGERNDLKKLAARKKYLTDEQRPEAVAKRRSKGQQTARENVAQLCDENTFLEYGGMVVAAQRYRRSEEDLIKNTPADGLVAGFGSVNKKLFNGANMTCCVMAYDYTVLAGTQGAFNHAKMDRVLQVAGKNRHPVILFAEGGGGRPGDVDVQTVAGLNIMTFYEYAKLSGLVPRIAIVSGYCFAGNAALAGASDILIATKNTSIGMGGPAMVEGGGLGRFHPKQIGPAEKQLDNGVIDILVEDEAAAILVAKKYLSYFQGPLEHWKEQDQTQLRLLVPENRKRVFDIRNVVGTLADEASFTELKSAYGRSIITGFIRIEGIPIGLIANDAAQSGGAITSDSADKAAGFIELCNQFNLPVLSLVDTPGIMVGPEAELSGTVRHAAKLFTAGAKLQSQFLAIVLRRGYGLGAMAMTGGSFHAADFIVSWPSGEFGAMGLEGAVKLGYRKELEAAPNKSDREALYQKLLAEAYRRGEAMNMAAFLEIDDVIDPADSRKWIRAILKS